MVNVQVQVESPMAVHVPLMGTDCIAQILWLMSHQQASERALEPIQVK